MEIFKNYLKNVGFVASLLGIYYLFIFCYTEKISFPLDITVLPSLVLALGLLSILITIVIVLYSSVSCLVVFDPLKISYRQLLYAKPHYSFNKYLASFFNFFLFFCFTPCLFFLLEILNYRCVVEATVLSIFLMPLLFSYYAMSPRRWIKNERFDCLRQPRFWRAYITLFCVGFLAFISILVFLKYVKFGLKIESDKEYQMTLFSFFALSYLIILPPDEKKLITSGNNPLPLYKELMSMPASLAYSAALIFAIWPSVAANTASASLRFLQIGGGLERSYYYLPEPKIAVPAELTNCTEKLCVTKNLHVVLDLGALLYVRGHYFDEDNTVLSLPRQSMFVVIHPQPTPSK